MSLPGFDSRQLALFRTVVEAGSLTAAARRVHVSQPAVTTAIQKLEAALGVTLLERSARGVTPTDAGRKLLGHARAVDALMSEALADVTERHEKLGPLVIGASTTIAAGLLPTLIARFREIEGDVGVRLVVGNTGEILDRIEDFVTGEVAHTESGRRFATVLFTDIVGSTARAAEMGDEAWLDVLDATNRICERQIDRFGGTSITTTGDGYLAIFDAPARAVATARAILDEVSGLGITMRAGLHTGEITLHGDNIAGIGVHIASRVINRAPDGGVAVSSTVKDLTVGSSIQYERMGSFELKGVPGTWTLYEVRS